MQSLRAGPNHAQRGNLVDGTSQIGAQSSFHSGNDELIDAQRAEQRMAADARDQIFFSSDDTGLWAAQKFVAAEHHQRYAGVDAVLDDRLGDSRRRQID